MARNSRPFAPGTSRRDRRNPLIGAVGDSFDNALAETVNGHYKADLVRGPSHNGSWKAIDDLKFATLGWVHWYNKNRLHNYLGDVPPARFESTFDAGVVSVKELVEIT